MKMLGHSGRIQRSGTVKSFFSRVFRGPLLAGKAFCSPAGGGTIKESIRQRNMRIALEALDSFPVGITTPFANDKERKFITIHEEGICEGIYGCPGVFSVLKDLHKDNVIKGTLLLSSSVGETEDLQLGSVATEADFIAKIKSKAFSLSIEPRSTKVHTYNNIDVIKENLTKSNIECHIVPKPDVETADAYKDAYQAALEMAHFLTEIADKIYC
jgi:hypothetical protein